MSKVEGIKAFIQKNAIVKAELAQVAQCYYSELVSDEIIEQQKDLIRHAKRLGILSVDSPFFEDAESVVLIRFNEFSRFIDLNECEVKVRPKEDKVSYHYSIQIDNLVLKAVETIPNEEHKKAQAI